MREAIDYNALGWVRKELGEALNKARQGLEAFAEGDERKELLQDCSAQLHQVRGPLQMVNLKGADMLAGEMEETIADLMLDSIEERDTVLELLMQGFLELPQYLSSLHTGKADTPTAMFPLVNSLRAGRGLQPLSEGDVFSPDLSSRVPAEVFDVRAEHDDKGLADRVRDARVRFQAGLLEWYRGGDDNQGMQALLGVLEDLQKMACCEPVVRLWWVGAGVAELVRDGVLEETEETKRLFGQLDRHIKRLLEKGESVFSDPLTDDFMKNLLFQLVRVETDSERINAIRSVYGLEGLTETESNDQGGELGDELLQTVSTTAREEVDRIKNDLDACFQNSTSTPDSLASVADQLRTLGSTLGMIGLEHVGSVVAEQEQFIRGVLNEQQDISGVDFSTVANALVMVEDALSGITQHGANAGGVDESEAVFRQGQDAVLAAVIADMSAAKESINEFLQSSGEFNFLGDVPTQLHKICGGLELIGEERLSGAASQTKQFIAHELLAEHRTLSEGELDSFADAICSIEYCVEQLGENQSYGDRAIEVAEESLGKLGYANEFAGEPAVETETEVELSVATEPPAESEAELSIVTEPAVVEAEAEPVAVAVAPPQEDGESTPISGLQVLGEDADQEIVEIFVEEAGEVLELFAGSIPAWCDKPDDAELLGEIRRGFHTIKGSGRMIGALATGEFAWAFENLLNNVIENTVPAGQGLRDLVAGSTGMLHQLVAQVTDNSVNPGEAADLMAVQAFKFSTGELVETEVVSNSSAGDEADVSADGQADSATETVATTQPESAGSFIRDLPVLSDEADPEIVEIFQEEAAEALQVIVEALPRWVAEPADMDVLGTVRRSFHTLKGSGRMAGAMVLGEFAWIVEMTFNKLLEGTIQADNALFEALAVVPEAVDQLLKQLRDGSEPAVNIEQIMSRLVACESVEQTIPDSVDVVDVIAVDEVADEPAEAATESPSLMETFIKECGEHLQSLAGCVAGEPGECEVTEPMFRSMHTLAGITELVDVPGIRSLVEPLYEYFGPRYHEGQPAAPEAITVLGDAVQEMSRQLEQLPDSSYDEQLVATLLERIATLAEQVAETADTPVVEAGTVTEEADNVVALEVETPDEVASEEITEQELPEDVYASQDQELYEIFVEEASEIMDSGETVLRNWSDDPDNTELMAEFQRMLHTLKGGARMVDITTIGDLGHAVESLLTKVGEGEVKISPDLFVLLHESFDRLSDMLDKVKSRQETEAAADLETRLDAFMKGDTSAAHATAAPVKTKRPAKKRAARGKAAAATAKPARAKRGARRKKAGPLQPAFSEIVARSTEVQLQGAQQGGASGDRREQVRVQSDVLDNLVNNAGEINIYRARLEQQISNYRFNLGELDQTISRLREQLRKLEMEAEAQILYRYEQESDDRNEDFDPLEMDRYSTQQQLSRSLSESISDLRSLQEIMESSTRDAETLLLQQSRVSIDLQESLIRTRMVPFAGLAPRLQRIVRQSARELDKKVELELRGADGEMDRAVVERIIAPLEHMLRNAVAHGIEKPEKRKRVKKSENGTIIIDFDREGPEIVLRIKDDGAGMDIKRIRARAIERGLIPKGSKMPDSEIMQFVLQAGFSTATEVTQISGRGVGMDVVHSEVKQLGGSLHIDSEMGEGTVFTVRLPYTLAINQALLVTAGEETFCVPLSSLEGVVRVYPDALKACYENEGQPFEYGDNNYQLKHLGSLLGTGRMDMENTREQVPVLLMRVGDQRVGFQVESLHGSREVVIKPVGAQLSTIEGISGATILGDGSVVLILDMVAASRMNAQVLDSAAIEKPKQDDHTVVMVVDDSITVRKVTTRLLERNGYQVLTAKDGVDAMGQLQDRIPDMMLLDIEMPRMDGFELATHMRNDERLRDVPIIMITSRTGDKHRDRALAIGVNQYLGKPFQEADLLDSIHDIIGAEPLAVGA
ncbi:MAG: Hpt domain-containing protein [Gammaproteobacteria bacterium]|nr:Hpt domain-containing protein [Gammaproteobacteria bacterium]